MCDPETLPVSSLTHTGPGYPARGIGEPAGRRSGVDREAVAVDAGHGLVQRSHEAT